MTEISKKTIEEFKAGDADAEHLNKVIQYGKQVIPNYPLAEDYESLFRLNGAGAGDAEINALRERAGLEPISGGDINAIMHESRCELAGENVRYQNLLRWHKAGIINLEEWYSANPPYPDKIFPDDIGCKIWKAPKDYYQPLPQLELDNSNGVLLQNPNWVAGGGIN
jgi:hypothetical protein